MQGKERKLFYYEVQDESSTICDKEYFRLHYFLKIIDTALVSFKTRFELYANHQNIFCFLYMNEIGNLDMIVRLVLFFFYSFSFFCFFPFFFIGNILFQLTFSRSKRNRILWLYSIMIPIDVGMMHRFKTKIFSF